MLIHELKPNQRRKSKKRVGRGGKRGTTSGRGTKGQRARAGHRIRPAERDVIQRLPKLRGVKNKPRRPKAAVLNVGDLERRFSEPVIDKKIFSGPVKILGGGEVKRAFEVKDLPVSKKAKEKIEKAGGKVG